MSAEILNQALELLIPWNYNSRNDNSCTGSKTSFICSSIGFNKDQNTMCTVTEATHIQSKLASNDKFESLLSSLLYQKHLQNLIGRILHLLGEEPTVW